jgi:hypothetical protein
VPQITTRWHTERQPGWPTGGFEMTGLGAPSDKEQLGHKGWRRFTRPKREWLACTSEGLKRGQMSKRWEVTMAFKGLYIPALK